MSKCTTFISGYKTEVIFAKPDFSKMTPEEQFQNDLERKAFMDAHFVQFKHTGICSTESIQRMAARKGIVRGLAAEAVSFDQSGKSRHITKKII
jgi:hypothetical protein